MKKVYFFLSLFLLSLVSYTAGAKTVSPYSLDFDDPLETADHNFAPVGWGHIVDYYAAYGEVEYVKYKWEATTGIDDSGALYIGSQELEIYDYDDEPDYKTCKDMLVTPAITGTSSIWVKKGKSGTGYIYFYTITEEGGKLKAGKMINVTVPTLNAATYVQVNIPQQPDGSRIGILGNNVYIDNFSAASAEIDQKTEIKVSSVTSNMPENQDADENGKFNVAFKVNVRNTGNVDIPKDTENFSISLINAILNDSVMATVAIPQDLAAGELSADIDISAEMDVNKFPLEYQYKIRENLGGSSVDGLKFKITPHLPTLAFMNSDQKKEYESGAVLDFGINKKEATGTFVLKNDGGADLNITELTAPEGYVLNKAAAFTVAPHDTAQVIMTMTAGTVGKKDGELVLKSNAGDLTFAVKGETADEFTYFVDFEDGIPTDCYNDWSTDSYPKDINMIGNTKAGYATSYSDEPKRLVTPLLEVKAGETMRFIAARKDDKSTLDILYSTDRRNWTAVRSISTTAENDADKLSDEVVTKGYWNNYYGYKEYTLDNIPAGKVYIAFDGKSVYVDNIYGFQKTAVDHDVFFTSTSMKDVGTVNTSITAHAKIVSMRDDAEEPEEYNLGLYVDDILAASIESVKLPQNKEVELTAQFIPHAVGKHNVTFKFIAGDYVVVSDPTEITISREISESEKAVGNKTGTAYTDGPVYTYEKESQTEIIYKPADIDLPVGTKITKMLFRGFVGYGNLDASVRVYMNSTDQTKFEENKVDADSTSMTKIFDKAVHFEQGGSAVEPVVQLELNFAEPIVYDGKGMHLLFVHKADTYKSVNFEFDGSITDQAKHSYNEWGTVKNEFIKLPVAYFCVATDPHTLSGKVTDKTTGAALKDAEVTLSNDGVEYYATTDAEGKYDMTIFKYDRKYGVSARKLGYYLEPMDSVDVNTNKENTLNIAMTEAKNLMIANAIAPKEGMVNYEYQMAVDVFNYTTADKKADGYWLKLKRNGEEIATAKTVDIAAGEKTTLLLSYTPHEVGTDKISAELTEGEKVTSGDEVEVAVAEEEAVIKKQVGDALSNAMDAPVNPYWKHSETQAIYPAKMLKMKKGMKITRIEYRGWTPGGIDLKAKLWIENTADSNENGVALGDTTKMQLIFDDEIKFADGIQVGSPTEPATLFTIDIPNGFVYEGENIRIAGRGDVLSSGSTSINYEVDNNEKTTTFYRSSDNQVEEKDWSRTYNTTVLYLTAEFKHNLSGTVKNKKDETPIENATVSMVSDDVVYATTTAADGKYSIDILQPSKVYKMTVTAEEYYDYMIGGISLDKDMVIDIPLEAVPSTVISGVAFSADSDVSIYSLDGTLIASGKNAIAKVANGTYIIKDNATNQTKKLIKK